jgi:TrmH family RNA methyltransferase
VSGLPLRFDSPKIQRLRRLVGRRSARSEEGVFVVEGPGLIAEAVAAGWDVESLFVPEGVEPQLLELAGIDSSATHPLGVGVLERVASTESPQPAIAVVVQRPAPAGLLEGARRIVLADRVGDPGNLGTILRSAEAAGFDAVVVTAGTVDAFNPKVVRSSAGALFHVPVLAAGFDDVRSAGLAVVATSSHRGTSHTRYDWPERAAIVAGNEAHGLADDVPADSWVRIDHAGRAESLNVAMATTLLCFESVRPH